MKSAVLLLTSVVAASSIACLDTSDPKTRRAGSRLAETRTIGKEAPATPTEEGNTKAKSEPQELAHAIIQGTVVGAAKVLRNDGRATVVVDVTEAPAGHYEVLMADAVGCKFDPAERMGGAVGETKSENESVPPVVTDTPQSRRDHAVAAGRTMTWNPFSVGELHVADRRAHLEATFPLKDLAVNPANGFRDKTVLIRKAGPASKVVEPVTNQVVGCGRFVNGQMEPSG